MAFLPPPPMRPRLAARARRWLAGAAAGLLLAAGLQAQQPQRAAQRAPAAAAPAPGADAALLDAREAVRRRDASRLAAVIASMAAAGDPLLPWAEYWALGLKLREASADEVEAFYRRWSGSFLEDRLRNDWLLELGRRRDFEALAREYPRFRMNDDREVRCWYLLSQHLAGRDHRQEAAEAWWAQRTLDDGCQMLATAMLDTGRFEPEVAWQKARLAVEQGRPAIAKAALALLGRVPAADVAEAIDRPLVHLRRAPGATRQAAELRLLALMRLAQDDAAAAAAQAGEDPGQPRLAAWQWATLARQAAMQRQPEAGEFARRVGALGPTALTAAWLSDETLAWTVRAALRHLDGARRAEAVVALTAAMSEAGRREPDWRYWRARALQDGARPGAAGDARRAEARELLTGLTQPADAHRFHGLLAAEALGSVPAIGQPVPPPTEAEREAVRRHPGLQRAWALNGLGLRGEARREWNFTLRELGERERLAAAREACERQDWQLCINTAERVDSAVDLALRYPTPWAGPIRAASARAGLEPALVFGLIRQETRFMPALRSHVGATGLMQVMPATAQIVARRIGLANCCSVAQLGELELNLQLGTRYLRDVLDDFAGSAALATAGYNAGPNRPRRWRLGGEVDAAVWVDLIPFNETRGYVQAVLANAAIYEAMQTGQPPNLRRWLGRTIGPPPVPAAPTAEDKAAGRDASPRDEDAR